MSRTGLVLAWAALVLAPVIGRPAPVDPAAGTVPDPIVDSKMTADEALEGLDRRCPKELRARQKVVAVTYWGFDDKVHRGQLVVDKELEKDVVEVFEVALKEKFPIRSVVPVAHAKFRKNEKWDDDLSMAANNTSAFNYREVTGGSSLSKHALGRAIDINPVQNPYIKGKITLPPDAKYDPKAPGTLTADHPVTKAFLARGWEWGGNWKSLKDYQHFEKPVPPAK
ncbi:M15 family metallopeptidase [Gemmata sp. G18]|uniref:M15 family metallopeptidase n=1 Tax=Gemmata palustris TaxID=2822762 RepID=A0ABS5BKS3_9BACT|nr:M15 family metallopeptidase [Gemmata palustris]MBP3954296.1 M15 family metallopeptidase [Gemmata palustris]